MKMIKGKMVFAADEKGSYARLKLKHLQEFGYPDLTLDEVLAEIDKLEKGEKPTNVIGMFINADCK